MQWSGSPREKTRSPWIPIVSTRRYKSVDGVRGVRVVHRHSSESGWVRGQSVIQVLVVMGDGHHDSLVDSGLFHVGEQGLGGCRAPWWREWFEHISGELLGDGFEDVEVSIDGRQVQPSAIGGSEPLDAGVPALEPGWVGLRYIRKKEQMSSMRWVRPRNNCSPRATSPTDAMTF